MRNQLFLGIVSAAVGGIIVAIFSYFVLGDYESKPSATKQYNAIGYHSEFFDNQMRFAKRVLEALAKDTYREKNREGGAADGWQALFDDFEQRINWWTIGDESIWGQHGVIEEISVDNNEDAAAIEVLVEGGNSNFVVVSNGSAEDEIFEGGFQREFKILPEEQLKILHVDRGRAFYSLSDNDSQDIFVSIDGEYLKPELTLKDLDRTFGSFFAKNFFWLFMLSISGAFFVVLIVASLLAQIIPRLQWLFTKTYDEKQLAFQILNWKRVQAVNQSLAERVEARSTELAEKLELSL